MKLYLITGSSEYLKNGGVYDGELCPITYDPYTLQPLPKSYIIKCDDGKYRKFEKSYFLPLEEMRNNKLNDLLNII